MIKGDSAFEIKLVVLTTLVSMPMLNPCLSVAIFDREIILKTINNSYNKIEFNFPCENFL